MSKHLLRLSACTALLAATAYAGSALAGEELYIATVCDDTGAYSTRLGSCYEPNSLGIYTTPTGENSALDDFYLSGKEYQFTHPNTDVAYNGLASGGTINGGTFDLGETFSAAPAAAGGPDPCYIPTDPALNVNQTYLIPKGRAGRYSWTIVLPKAPESGINLQVQCAVLKPNTNDITVCAGEEGEIQDVSFCTQRLPTPGVSPLNIAALPIISAVAYPGLHARQFSTWAPFNVTAYKVPGSFVLSGGAAMTNSDSLQILQPGANTRMPLKACVTENIYIKQPVAGQVNAAGQTEQDLVEGDYLVVQMALPRGHTMDVYCHAQSVRLAGIGDPFTLLP